MIGWGYFELPMVLTFQDYLGKDPVTVEHILCFEGRGDTRTINISFSKSKLQEALSLKGMYNKTNLG